MGGGYALRARSPRRGIMGVCSSRGLKGGFYAGSVIC